VVVVEEEEEVAHWTNASQHPNAAYLTESKGETVEEEEQGDVMKKQEDQELDGVKVRGTEKG